MWNHLRANNISDIPWLVGSDFNNIIRTSEKQGGLLPDTGSMQDFQECLVDTNLSEISFTWTEFTWCNNQTENMKIWQRLDHVLYNGSTFVHLPELQVPHLQQRISDHSPLLTSAPQIPYKPKFTFQRIWMDHTEFQSMVEQIWITILVGHLAFE